MRWLLIFLLLMPYASGFQPGKSWQYNLNEEVKSVSVSPQGNYIAAGTSSGKLVLLDKTKKLIFSRTLESPVYSLAVGENATFLLAGDGYSLLYFNKSGDLLWKTSLYDNVNNIAFRGSHIAAVTSSKQGFLLNSDGKVIFRKNLDSSARGTALSRNRVYFSTAKGTVYSFDFNGDEKWQYYHGRFIYNLAYGNNTLALISNMVVFLRNGIKQSYYDGGVEFTSISYSDNGYFLVSGGNKVAALSPGGRELWSFKSDKEVVSSEAGGKSFVTGSGETLIFYREPDVILPGISVISPENGSKVSGVVRIDFRLNKPSEAKVLIDGNYACSSPCNWDTSASSPGEHTIKIIATDKNGKTVSGEIKVIVTSAHIKAPLSGFERELKNKTEMNMSVNLTLPDFKENKSFSLGFLVFAFISGLILPPVLYYLLSMRRNRGF